MEQQKLPNAVTAIVLASISFICCCFSMGIGGVVLSGLAYFLVNKDEKLYAENPENYSNYNQLKTAKIIAIIGLALGILTLVSALYYINELGGWDAYMEQTKDLYKDMGIELD